MTTVTSSCALNHTNTFQTLQRLFDPYHGEEKTKLVVERHEVTVGEDELFLAIFLRREDDVDLLRGDRQHGQLNTIELVEAAPRSRLSQTYDPGLAKPTSFLYVKNLKVV